MTHNERYWNTMTWVRSFSILGLIIQEIASHTPVDTFKKKYPEVDAAEIISNWSALDFLEGQLYPKGVCCPSTRRSCLIISSSFWHNVYF